MQAGRRCTTKEEVALLREEVHGVRVSQVREEGCGGYRCKKRKRNRLFIFVALENMFLLLLRRDAFSLRKKKHKQNKTTEYSFPF